MNLSAIGGLAATFIVFGASVFIALGGFGGFIDPPSALIVIGGSICATVVCVPMRGLKKAVSDTTKKVFKKNTKEYSILIDEISAIAQAKRKGDSAFDAAVKNVKEPYLQDAAKLLFWAEAEVSEEEFRNLLETKADTYMSDHEVSVNTYKIITKFPTAFGMMGTVLGLIALLQSLSNPDAKSMIGPAMAVALVTTLYGLVINNLYLIPVTDNLVAANQEERKVYDICIEGLLLIQQRKPTKYIEEKLRAYLMPDRLGILAGVKTSSAA